MQTNKRRRRSNREARLLLLLINKSSQPSIKLFAFGISKLNYLLKSRESPDDDKLKTTEYKTNLYLELRI